MYTILGDFRTKDKKINTNTIFPLRVEEEGAYLGMGENGSRFKLTTNDGRLICYSDYEPKYIKEINNAIKQ